VPSGLERTAAGLGRLNRRLLVACRTATVALCAALTAVVAVGVFWRYVLDDALSWSEEVAKFAMVWLTFTGAPLALVAGGHVAIEILPRLLPRRARHLLFALVLAIVVAVLAMLAWRGATFAWNGRSQVAAMLGDVSMAWVFAAIPIGSAIMLAVALEQALRHLLHALAPDRHAAPVAEGATAGVD
jgi:TRAP-type C4-dicarboxylate transport system permease small subunit